VLVTTAWTGLVLLVAAGDFDASAGQVALAQRIARVEADVCAGQCPPLPRDPTSDWLRSEEGRRANACPMMCRVDQPAAALFRQMVELASARPFDANSSAVTAQGKDAPDLARRLHAALRDGDGKKLGPLCARARRLVTPSDEAAFLECVGRVAPHDATVALAAPDGARALRCSATFAERELDWLSRCPALEARAGVEACVNADSSEAAARAHRHAGAGSRERCENEAVERLAAVFRRGARH